MWNDRDVEKTKSSTCCSRRNSRSNFWHGYSSKAKVYRFVCLIESVLFSSSDNTSHFQHIILRCHSKTSYDRSRNLSTLRCFSSKWSNDQSWQCYQRSKTNCHLLSSLQISNGSFRFSLFLFAQSKLFAFMSIHFFILQVYVLQQARPYHESISRQESLSASHFR